MRNLNNRQTTAQRMKAIKKKNRKHNFQKGSKRVPLSRREK
jgi:hypothetical protein